MSLISPYSFLLLFGQRLVSVTLPNDVVLNIPTKTFLDLFTLLGTVGIQ